MQPADSIRYVGEELDDEYTRNDEDEEQIIKCTKSYLSWPKEDAPRYLSRMKDHYLDATWLTDMNGAIFGTGPLGETPDIHSHSAPHLRYVLREGYGWPGNFQEAE